MDAVLRYMRNHSFNDSNSPRDIEGINGARIQSYVKTFVAHGYVDVYTPTQPPILKSYSLSSQGELLLDVEGGYEGQLKKKMRGYQFIRWTLFLTILILLISLYPIIKDCITDVHINKPQNTQREQLQTKPPMSSANSPNLLDTAHLSSHSSSDKEHAKQKDALPKVARKP